MKKTFLILFIILPVLLLVSCPEEPVWQEEEDEFSTDVVYSDDWKYITLFLDDASAPDIIIHTSQRAMQRAQMQRAMTVDTARRAFDFFEVIFVYGDNTARASWEIGQRASITNVFRTEAGIDYSSTTLPPPNQSSGSAVLFAGRKTDFTLLAVGKIVYVDDEPGTIITTENTSVTFMLSIITASVNHIPSYSSFRTAASDHPAHANVSAGNTQIINALLGLRPFPLYKLPGGRSSVAAEYTFAFDNTEWADFADSIIRNGSGTVIKREARFPAGSGTYWYIYYPEDITTVVIMTNNQTEDLTALENPIRFSFDTTNTAHPVETENGIFALAFEIPVYAMSGVRDTEGNEAITWHIRPAFQSYLFNIDNGRDSSGGAVLIGADIDIIGELEAKVYRR
jgi:hypothetical protein